MIVDLSQVQQAAQYAGLNSAETDAFISSFSDGALGNLLSAVDGLGVSAPAGMEGAVPLLYSGENLALPDGTVVPLADIALDIAQSSGGTQYVLQQTDAGAEMVSWLASAKASPNAIADNPLSEAIADYANRAGISYSDAFESVANVTNNLAWREASGNMVTENSTVNVITNGSLGENSTFIQIEYPATTSINGIPTDTLPTDVPSIQSTFANNGIYRDPSSGVFKIANSADEAAAFEGDGFINVSTAISDSAAVPSGSGVDAASVGSSAIDEATSAAAADGLGDEIAAGAIEEAAESAASAGVGDIAYGIETAAAEAMGEAAAGDLAAAATTMAEGATVAALETEAAIEGEASLGGVIAEAAEFGADVGSFVGPEGALIGAVVAAGIGAAVYFGAGDLVKDIAKNTVKAMDDLGSLLGSRGLGGYLAKMEAGFSSAQHDPLLIDLSGSGFNISPLSVNSPYFQYSTNSLAQQTAWIGSGTGFLATVGTDDLVDGAGNLISSFSQLAEFALDDSDVITGSALNNIVVWQDLNNDGICEAGEVQTLAQLGVVSISLETSTINKTVGDSEILQTAIATMADGSTREIASVSLDVSNIYTKYVGDNTITSAVAALPDIKGYGTLPDLSIAMGQDSQLQSLVETLIDSDPLNSASFDSALESVLYEWAGASNITSSPGEVFDAQKLSFISALSGVTSPTFLFSDVPFVSDQGDYLQQSWNAVFDAMKARILVQLPNSVFSSVFSYDSSKDLILPNSSFENSISLLASSAPSGANSVAYWSNALLVVDAGVTDVSQFLAPDTATIAADLRAVVPDYFSDAIVNAAAAGTLTIVSGAELGANYYGGAESDLFIASIPDSTLVSSGGKDEFVVSSGLGTTEIVANALSETDNVLLLQNISPSQVTISADSAGDILLDLNDGSTVKLDKMLVSGGSGSEAYGVQTVVFGDGSSLSASNIIQSEIAHGAGNGHVYGTPVADVFDGNGDYHYEEGNGGNDTFVYNSGYGQLEINEYEPSAERNNILFMDAGIAPSQIEVSHNSAGDIILTDGINGDQIKIDLMLSQTYDGVQAIQFSDGTIWSLLDIRTMLATGSMNNTTLFDAFGGLTLDPAGYAHLVTTDGRDDTVLFNTGDGQVEINERSSSDSDDNILQFGAGITPDDVQINGDGKGNLILTVGTNGDMVQLDGMLLSSYDGVQEVKFADGTVWSAADIIGQVPSSEVSGNSYYASISYAKGNGAVVVNILGHGEIDLGSNISSSDVYLQGDAAGDLILKLRDDSSDSLTLVNDLYQANTVDGQLASQVGEMNFSDGTSVSLSGQLNFTWIASSTQLKLAGMNDVDNTFDLAAGGDQISLGDKANVIQFGKGDGNAVVTMNGGLASIQMGAGISQSDVALQSDSAGDLIVRILDTDDTLTFKGALSTWVWYPTTAVTSISFSDGTVENLTTDTSEYTATDLTFTYIGTNADTNLIGSDYGSNVFYLGTNDTVTLGNDSDDGSGLNTLLFDRGCGQTVVDMNGGYATVQLGTDIANSDVIFQADDAGDLTIALRDDPNDSITFEGALSTWVWYPTTRLTSIAFGDGTSEALTTDDSEYTAPALNFTWIGTSDNTTLVGSDYGSNTFDLGSGGDTVTLGNSSDYGSGLNTVLFDKGNGHVVVNTNDGYATLSLGADIAASDVILQADNDGNLTVALRDDPNDSITFEGALSTWVWYPTTRLTSIAFGDGTSEALTTDTSEYTAPALNFTWIGTSDNTTLVGSNYGSNTFDLGAGGDTVTLGNNSDDGSGLNVLLFEKGDGAVTINENGGQATVVLASDIRLSDITFSTDASGDELVLIGNSGDQLTFTNVTTAPLIDVEYEGQEFAAQTGTTANDSLIGSTGADVFDGRGGSDYEEGNGGSDIFIYNAGYGQLEINEYGSSDSVLELGSGITPDQVAVSSDSSGNIYLTDGTTGDRVLIDRQLYESGYGIEEVHFADGTIWTQAQLNSLATTGSTGNNTLYGSTGADVFDGHGGSDYEQGGGGGDTFIYNAGYGRLEVNEYGDGDNIVQLGAGITPSDITVTGDDEWGVSLTDGTTGDTLHLDFELYNPGYGVEEIRFADGTIWTKAQIDRLATTGTTGNDSLYGTPTADIFDGKGGNDYEEGEGVDDTFVYNAGYGQLEINEVGDGNNVLQLGSGIAPGDIAVSGDDDWAAYLTDGVTGDRIQLDNELHGPGDGVEQVQFSDGTVWTQAEIETAAGVTPAAVNIVTGTSGNDNLIGTSGSDVFDGQGGSDYEQGNGGGDRFIYNAGYGQLVVYEYGSGNNVLALGSGTTTSDVTVKTDTSSLYLTDGVSGDQVKIDDMLEGSRYSDYSLSVQFADGTVWTPEQLLALATTGSASNTSLYGTYGADIFDSKGYASYELGNGGDDTFIYNAGYGVLEINENGLGNNIVQFGASISPADITVGSDNDWNIYLTDATTGDSLRLDREFYEQGYGVEEIKFSDGTIWTQAQIDAMATIGTTGNNSLYGTIGADTFDGNGGDDYENGNGGADVFLYKQGYGNLEISDYAGSGVEASSTLEIGQGIKPSDIDVSADSNNLILTIGSSGHTIQLDQMMLGSSYGVGSVSFASGLVWSAAQLLAAATGTGSLPLGQTVSGTAGDDQLQGTAPAEIFDGKGGTDSVTGEGGGDTFLFNPGYGVLTINEQDNAAQPQNVLSFGAGIDPSDIGLQADTSGDVIITDGTSGDDVILTGMMNSTASAGVQSIAFSNGTTKSMTALMDESSTTLTVTDGYLIVGDDSNSGATGNDNVIQLGVNESFVLNGADNTVLGGSDVNIITVTGDGNAISGGSGGANLSADGSYNILSAGTDFAQVEADGGNYNTLIAGAGTNTLVANGSHDLLFGGAGYAEVDVTGNNNHFVASTATTGNNDVTFTGNGNVFTGDAAGANYLAIGDDNTLVAGTSFNTIEADGSDNTLESSSGSATLIVSAGTDSLATGNVLIAGSGYTEMDVTGNGNSLVGGTGTNSLSVTGDSNILIAGTSFALLSADGNGNTLTGGSAINTLIANGDSNIIHAGSSYEEVDVTGDGNTFVAGAGNGDLTVDGDNNHVTGSDNAYWSATITGTGNVVTSGQNTVGVTAETLGNTYSAGDGYMILDYSYASAVTVNMAAGTATATGMTATDTIASSVSEVHVGFNSTVTAGSDPMLLEATGNNNTLTGGAGDDDIISDGIFNTLAGGAGLNTLEASSGNNVFLIDGTGSNIIQNGTSGGSAAVNQMQFLNSITDQDLWFEQSGNDLDIVQIGTNNTTDLQNWFSGVGSQLQSFQDANGLSLSNSDVSTLVTAMASYQSAHSSFNAATTSAMPTDTSLHNAIAAAWQS